MAGKNPEKRIKITSPAGVAVSAFIDKPSDKFKKEGEYSVKLRLTKAQADAIRPQIDAAVKKGMADGLEKKPKMKWESSSPLKLEETEDGEETGFYVLSAKRSAVRVVKNRDGTTSTTAVTIPVFDASPAPKRLTPPPRIGRGSTLKVSFNLSSWAVDGQKKAGATAYLDAVQVIKLEEYGGGGNAEAYGFGGEEDGYTAPDADEPAPFDKGGNTAADEI